MALTTREHIKIKRTIALVPQREGAAFWECSYPRNLAVVARSYTAQISIGKCVLYRINLKMQALEFENYH